MESPDYLSFRSNFDSPDFLAAFDEAPLWSAAFGQLLLAHVPMRAVMKVLDVGCGTGFPTLELAGRLGPASEVWGLDPWAPALVKAREKARISGLGNAHFREGDAAAMPFVSETFDLIVSNLGVNNFADPAATLAECQRVLKPGGCLALTTNLVGHMAEFYAVFARVLDAAGDATATDALAVHVAHRATVPGLRAMLAAAGLHVRRVVEDTLMLRYANGTALLNQYFIKFAFLDAWKAVVPTDDHAAVFLDLERALNARAAAHGGLTLTVPMAYVEAGQV